MLKKILPFILTINVTFNSIGFVYANDNAENNIDYLDHWARSSIENLISYNIISGYEDGSIKPNNIITKAEFTTIINKIFSFSEKDDTNFADVSETDWYADQFLIAKKAGYLTGDENGNAKPLSGLKRSEICVILSKILELELTDEETDFDDDSQIPLWAKPYINALHKIGFISGYEDNTFRATKELTRAESFTVLDSMIQTFVTEYEEYQETVNSSNTSTDKEVIDEEETQEQEVDKTTETTETQTTTTTTSSGGSSSSGSSGSGSSSSSSSSSGSSGSGSSSSGSSSSTITTTTIQLNGNGGTITNSSGVSVFTLSVKSVSDLQTQLETLSVSREGYTFDGWVFVLKNGVETSLSKLETSSLSGLTVKASWTENIIVEDTNTENEQPEEGQPESDNQENNGNNDSVDEPEEDNQENGGNDGSTGLQDVIITDSFLRSAIASELGIDENQITTEALARLDMLEIDGTNLSDDQKITSLEGLEYCTNLITLKLPNHKISDISVLINLTSLEVIDLSYNEITSDLLYCLASLENISELNLQYNYIDIYDNLLLSDCGYILDNIESIVNPQRFVLDIHVKDRDNNEPLQGITVTLKSKDNTLTIERTTDAEGNIRIEGSSDTTLNNIFAYEFDIIYTDSSDNYLTTSLDLDSMMNYYFGKSYISTTLETNIVTVEDETLRELLLTKTNADDGVVRKTALKEITDLELNGNGTTTRSTTNKIQDLSGLEWCINLQTLILPNHSIQSITPLKDLTTLVTVDLSNNQIQSSEGVENLTNLTYLNLENNYITDFKALDTLKNKNNNVATVYDSITSSQKTSITINVTNADFIVDTTAPAINDLEVTLTLKNDTSQTITGTVKDGVFYKDDITAGTYTVTLSNPNGTTTYYLDNITTTEADLNGISSLEFSVYETDQIVTVQDDTMKKLFNYHLNYLSYFKDAGITRDLDAVVSERELAVITKFSETATKEITTAPSSYEDLLHLVNLKELDLSTFHKVTNSDLDIIGQLTTLEILDLGENSITDITPLANLTNLTKIVLTQLDSVGAIGNITDITPLQNLTKLVTVHLGGNEINTVGLTTLPNTIKELKIGNCSLTSLDFITHFTDLETLNIANYFNGSSRPNNIVTLEPLLNLNSLKTLTLRRDSIQTDVDTHIAMLELKGVKVTVL